ncbi:uncharacterized protein METZ01_LOCUS262981, partial [marine metagenome]
GVTIDELRSETKFLIKKFRISNKNSLTNEEKLLIKIKGLNNLIRNKLIIMEAKNSGIFLASDEYERSYQEAINGYDGDSFSVTLSVEGIPAKIWESRLKNRLLISKFIQDKFKPNDSSFEKKIHSYYEENKEKFKKGKEVHALHIMVATEDEAKHINKLLKSGKKSFSKLSREHSLSPEAAIGGDLGYFEISQMPQEFGPIVKLKENQISEIIKTPYGYHIFKLVRVKRPRELSFSEAKGTIYNQLLRDEQSQRFEKWLIEFKKNSNIEIRENVLSKFNL